MTIEGIDIQIRCDGCGEVERLYKPIDSLDDPVSKFENDVAFYLMDKGWKVYGTHWHDCPDCAY